MPYRSASSSFSRLYFRLIVWAVAMEKPMIAADRSPPPRKAPAIMAANAAMLTLVDLFTMSAICLALTWAISWASTAASSPSVSTRLINPRFT